MGYTHYWYTADDLPGWPEFEADARKIVAASVGMGLKLAGPMGTGDPEITGDVVALNGAVDCGHKKDERISIPWPATGAAGVASDEDDPVDGAWFAGTLLTRRACGGDCSYETFSIARRWPTDPKAYIQLDESGARRFECCKTAYRPYDVTVTAILIAAKRRFGDRIRVVSDGEDEHWEDGRILCHVACGYGRDFHLVPDADGGHALQDATVHAG